MPGIGIRINKEQDYVVIYTTTRGMWTTSNGRRKLVAVPEEIPRTDTITVTATDFMKAKAIAYSKINSKKMTNEYIKVLRAVPIPIKQEAV